MQPLSDPARQVIPAVTTWLLAQIEKKSRASG
jgi:hypothetical protein